MKTTTHRKIARPNSPTSFTFRPRLLPVLALAAWSVASGALAANQTWTNAPQDSAWNNTNNWVAQGIPGALNQTGNSINNDVATFYSPIPLSGIGGIGNPVTPDNAVTTNTRCRTLGRIIFDTADCGAYVVNSPSAPAGPDTSTPEAGRLHLCHNGGVTLNAAVTNRQAFLLPIGVRLPSSTDGQFYLTNNATSPQATLFLQNLYLDGATTRGVTYTLEGSNTGTNTIAYLSQSPIFTTGVSGVRKLGTGTWILSGSNYFRATAPMNILAGTLIVKDPNAFGSATAATVTNTGTLQIDGVTLLQISLNLNNGGTIRMNGTADLNGVAVGAQSGTRGTVSTTSAGDVVNVGSGIAAGAMVTGGGADTVFNTAGPGTLVFGQANTYAGNWSFNAATNRITNGGALGTGPNANVAAGAVLDLTPLGVGAFTPTTAGFGGSGAGTAVGSSAAAVVADPGGTLDLGTKPISLTFSPASSSGDAAHPALYIAQGSLSLGGNNFFVNNASGVPLGAGTYRLITQASGSVLSSGSHSVIVSGAGLATFGVGAIQVSGGNVDLVVVVYIPKTLSWKGGNPDATWDLNTTANFDNGGGFSVFNNSDIPTFGPLGAAYPTVTLVGALAPGAVTVDTSANDYTFVGAGQIAGATSLTKVNSGVLTLGTVNSYVGGTVVSNGTLRVGIAEAIPSSAGGNVAVWGAGVLDLNGLANTINGLDGTGTVDNQGGSPSVLTVGNNDKSGTFTGVLKNTTSPLALTKIGIGTQSLSASNSYTGGTTINVGTLAVANPYALGPAGDLTMGGGTLDVRPPALYLNSLAGSAGTIANNSTTTTNTLVVQGASSTTFSGSIVDGASGKMALSLPSGTLRLNAANTFTGGTVVGSGAALNLGNSPASLAGSVIASNGASLGLLGGSSNPGTPASVTTVDGGTLNFYGNAEGNSWSGQFYGSANTTNRFNGPASVSGATSFSNFLGVVQLAVVASSNPNFRFNNANAGGDSTTFEFESGLVHTRDSQTVRLGSIRGGSSTCGIGGAGSAGAIGTWIIGARNEDNAFHGYISGSNNLVKTGSGRLTLDGVTVTTNTDNATYTNYLYTSLITYPGNTTVSNGVLTLVVPNNLSNSFNITLAGAAAVLDASRMGYVVDQLDATSTVTNQVLVTNGVLEVYPGQALAGFGAIQGSLVADAASTINVGLPVGTLAVSGSATLNGAATVNMKLDRSSAPTAGKMTATAFAGSGATLNVVNSGPTLVTGDTFQLFSGPVTVFTTVSLPATDATGQIPYVWQNNLTTDGSIRLTSGLSPAPATITASVTGGGTALELSWPTGYTGWTLQGQTNSMAVGLSNNWVTVAGSTATNRVILPVVRTNPTAFYRLVLPQP